MFVFLMHGLFQSCVFWYFPSTVNLRRPGIYWINRYISWCTVVKIEHWTDQRTANWIFRNELPEKSSGAVASSWKAGRVALMFSAVRRTDRRKPSHLALRWRRACEFIQKNGNCTLRGWPIRREGLLASRVASSFPSDAKSINRMTADLVFCFNSASLRLPTRA